jgi:8-oxo-dGTP diphosphatase
MPKEYETAKVAADPVIFTIANGSLCVLLNVREKEPYKGRHELPGVLLLRGEDPETAINRKLKSLFDDAEVYFTQFRTFYAPNRDPRTRTVSIGFIALVPAGLIADTKSWFGVSRLPGLAFDHAEIIKEAERFLKKNLNALIAKQFLPDRFPLNQLQHVYETIEGTKYDNRNFRKKIIYDKVVVETKEFLKNQSNRPPRLYRFASK